MIDLESKRKRWAANQRRAFRNGTLSSEKIALLEKHGFEFQIQYWNKVDWEDRWDKVSSSLLELAQNNTIRPKLEYPISFMLFQLLKKVDFVERLRKVNSKWLLDIWDNDEVVNYKKLILDLIDEGDLSFLQKDNFLNKLFIRSTIKGKKHFDLEFTQKIIDTKKVPWYLWHRQHRMNCINAKYGGTYAAYFIYENCPWEGQSEEEIMDSKGIPEEVIVDGNKKTLTFLVCKKAAKWKYFLQDGRLTGWSDLEFLKHG